MISLAIAAACVQAIDGSIPITQLMFGQFLAQLLCSVPCLAYRRTLPKVTSERNGGVSGVVVAKYIAHVMFYISTTMAPAGVVQAMFNSATTIVCMVRDLYVRKGCRSSIALPISLCLIGLVMTSQPEFLGFPAGRDASLTSWYISPCQHTSVSNNHRGITTTNSSTMEPVSKGLPTKTPSINYSRLLTTVNPTTTAVVSTSSGIVGYSLSVGAGALQGVSFMICSTQLTDTHPNVVSFWCGSVNSVV